jgi:hypothetical protein
MDLVKYRLSQEEQTVEEGFLSILDQRDPLSSESDYVLLTPGEIIPTNSYNAVLRSGTLAEVQLENRLYRTKDNNLVEVGAKVQIELDPTHIYEFMSELITRQDLTLERLEEKLNIKTTIHRQVSEGIQDLSEMFPDNKEIISEHMDNELVNSLTAYGLKITTTITIDRPDIETKNLVEMNKLKVEKLESEQGIFETMAELYSKEAEMMKSKIRASPEYIKAQVELERDMKETEAFFGPARDKMLDLMEKNEEGQNTVIQVGKDGTANIHIGKKKKNNNS